MAPTPDRMARCSWSGLRGLPDPVKPWLAPCPGCGQLVSLTWEFLLAEHEVDGEQVRFDPDPSAHVTPNSAAERESEWDAVGALTSVECIDTDAGLADVLSEEEARRLLEGLHEMGYYLVNVERRVAT